MTSAARLVDAIDARFGWDPPKHLGVAVSGGSDSLALLSLLVEWGRSKLYVATVDHGLRKEAAEEAAYVARICESFDIPHETLRWSDWDGQGNVQDAARRGRYALLARWGKKRKLAHVLLGHTKNDVAETFLMRLKRGAGLDGLAAMKESFSFEGQRFTRPLLTIDRSALRDFLDAQSLRWIDDPSNADERFDRVKVRKALESFADLDISAQSLADTAFRLREEANAMAMAAYHRAETVAEIEGGDVVFNRRRLLLSGPRMVDRLVSAALCWVASRGYPPRGSALQNLTASFGEPGQITTLHGCQIDVRDATLRISREWNAVWDKTARFGRPWDTRWHIKGPGQERDEIRALGEAGLNQVENWRETGLPRATLLSSPSVWRGGTLIAAPVADTKSAYKADVPLSFFASILEDETSRL